jgi:lysophospholipid acyltransferase (LPLAT)-like uncharacterized protein
MIVPKPFGQVNTFVCSPVTSPLNERRQFVTLAFTAQQRTYQRQFCITPRL